MIGINQVGIQKCQYGTSRGGLVNYPNFGSWGDRGEGNELQSALENGLSQAADKVVNFGAYIDQGLAYLAGALPGGMTAQESLQEERNKQLAGSNGERGYVNNQGEYKLFPIVGMPPSVGFPKINTQKWNQLNNAYRQATKITASGEDKIYWFRRAASSDDRFVSGINLEKTLETIPNNKLYQAHGMTKGHDSTLLADLRTVLNYGIDPGRPFYTAPIHKIEGGSIGAAIGTSSGKAYSQGPFMLIRKGVENNSPFTHVLINDGLSKEGAQLANKYKLVLQKEFPNVKFLTYGEVSPKTFILK